MQGSTKVTTRPAASGAADTAVLVFSGDISAASKETILAAYHGLDGNVKKVLLDFRGVSYINSSGIAVIIQMLMEARMVKQRTVGIFGLTPHFQKVFNILGVPKYATLGADEAGVLAAI